MKSITPFITTCKIPFHFHVPCLQQFKSNVRPPQKLSLYHVHNITFNRSRYQQNFSSYQLTLHQARVHVGVKGGLLLTTKYTWSTMPTKSKTFSNINKYSITTFLGAAHCINFKYNLDSGVLLHPVQCHM